MRVFSWPLALVAAAVLTFSCSNNTPADASIEDANDGAELEPCQAAAPVWNEIWKYRLEEPQLAGSTPDNNLIDVWGSAADDIYAVGYKGTILHFDGKTWSAMDSGVEEDLEGVWGYVLKDAQGAVIRTDVFAAGSGGRILRYDGKTWAPERVISDPDPSSPKPQPVTDNFHDIWGIPATGPEPQSPTVIAVGGEGLIVRYEATLKEFREMQQRVAYQYNCGDTLCDGYTYQRWSLERLGGVFGASPSYFVAVGNNGSILSYDGTAWARQAVTKTGGGTAFTTHMNGVWGRSAGDIFAVGLDGTVVRGGTGGWKQWDLAMPPVYLRSVWAFNQSKCGETPDGGTTPGDTSWIIFAGWDGTLLLFHDDIVCPFAELTNNRLEGIWGTSPRDETTRTLPDGGVVCDPVEVLVSGVKATLVRLSNSKGR